MLSTSRRHLLVLALLVVGVGAALAQRRLLAPKTPAVPPGGSPSPVGTAAAERESALRFIYFVDVDGWYRITPYETVVRSAFDLTPRSGDALAQALPETVGSWRQVGPEVDLRQDSAVIEYLGHPRVAVNQAYQDASGHVLSLSILGNTGDESYLLFSHTPETCLPGQLWNVVEKRRESVVIDDRPIYTQYVLTKHARTGERQIALYWYLWDNAGRDSKNGVVSMRVYVQIESGESESTALARAWTFVRGLFPATIPWNRF